MARPFRRGASGETLRLHVARHLSVRLPELHARPGARLRAAGRSPAAVHVLVFGEAVMTVYLLALLYYSGVVFALELCRRYYRAYRGQSVLPFWREWASSSCTGGALCAAVMTLSHQQPWGYAGWTESAVGLIVWLLLRRRGKRRRRVSAAAGARAKARIAAMRRTMRERRQPRPVLEPLPRPA